MLDHSADLSGQYRQRARTEAETADLANVRERCLRSEAAWNAMAARVQQTEDLRARRLAEAAKVAA